MDVIIAYYLKVENINGRGKIANSENTDGSFYNISSCHAEMNVIKKIKHKKNKPVKLDMLVVRINKFGILKNSKPCIHCINYIIKSKLNIKNIYYSSYDSSIIKSNINELCYETTKFVSYGMRKNK
jgi:tRNA(Arg) A34 adenosine deaminase TadA